MNAENELTDWTVWLARQRYIATNYLLGIIVVLGSIGMVLSLARAVIFDDSWTFPFIYLVCYSLISFLYLNKNINSRARGIAFVSVLLIFAIFSLYSGWLAGSGRIYMLAAVVIAAVLVSPRAGFITAGVTIGIFVIFGVGHASGLIPPPPPLDQLSIGIMADELISFLMGVGVIATGLWFFGQALKAANQASHLALQSRKNFHNIVERSSDGIMITDHHGKILFANKTSAQFLNIPIEELTGSQVPFPVVLYERSEIKVSLPTRKKGTAEVSFNDTEWEGQPAYLVDIRDISDRKRIEQEVLDLNTELEQRVEQRTAQLESTNKELEAFSYSVSHDLRAPLRSVDGFSRILLQDFGANLPDEGKRFLNIIRESALQMNNLIDDLLRLSRLNRIELHLSQVDLTPMAREIFDRLRLESPNRQAELLIMEKLSVTADDRLMRIVLENLISNAWKFTGKKESTIIEVGKITSTYGEKAFFIRDNGVGFDAVNAARLFGAFQRFHSNEEFVGTGIGLAIVQRVIHRHGGHIWAESKPGEGATFYFTL